MYVIGTTRCCGETGSRRGVKNSQCPSDGRTVRTVAPPCGATALSRVRLLPAVVSDDPHRALWAEASLQRRTHLRSGGVHGAACSVARQQRLESERVARSQLGLSTAHRSAEGPANTSPQCAVVPWSGVRGRTPPWGQAERLPARAGRRELARTAAGQKRAVFCRRAAVVVTEPPPPSLPQAPVHGCPRFKPRGAHTGHPPSGTLTTSHAAVAASQSPEMRRAPVCVRARAVCRCTALLRWPVTRRRAASTHAARREVASSKLAQA